MSQGRSHKPAWVGHENLIVKQKREKSGQDNKSKTKSLIAGFEQEPTAG